MMNTHACQFRIGTFTCTAVADGCMNFPLASLFANVPRSEVGGRTRQSCPRNPAAHLTG